MNCQVIPQVEIPPQLKNANLPVLPLRATHLIRSLSAPDLSIPEIAAIVEMFPSITMRLLALVNSVWSAPASPIHSLAMACSRLGLDIVRSVSIALTVAAPFDPRRCPGFDAERYWMCALLTADAAHALAEVLPPTDETEPDSIRTAGLLHNIGLIWMATQMPQETAGALATKLEQPEASLSSLMRNSIGLDYASAGAFLGETWNLPGMVVQPMAHHGNDSYQGDAWQAVRLVRYARSLVSVLLDGEEGDRQTAKLVYVQQSEFGELTTTVLDDMRNRLPRVRALAQELFGGSQ